MIHKNLGLVQRSAMKSRKHGGETMIRKAYWGVLASLFLALAFGTGCNSTTATPPPTQVVTITATPGSAYAQNTTLNTQFAAPFSVTVTTNGAPGTPTPGTPVVGAVVVFTAPASGAGGTFANGTNVTSATTDANGIAVSSTFTNPTPPATPALVNPFTADGTPGVYNVIASSAITTSTATFYLSNTLVPVPITVAGGSPQSTSVSTQFATALSVTVTDGATPTPHAVSGLPITFTVNPAASGASGVFADTFAATTTATTNSSGLATAAAFTANATVGTYTVTASTIDGATPNDANTATFTLSNTIVPTLITPVAGSTPQTTAATTAFANPLAVVVTGAAGAPVVGAVVTFTAPAQPAAPAAAVPGGTFSNGLATITVTTDATGTATAGIFTANTAVSPVGPPVVTYNVTASVVVQSGTTLSTDSETPTDDFVLTND
jgi:hypothetical protein